MEVMPVPDYPRTSHIYPTPITSGQYLPTPISSVLNGNHNGNSTVRRWLASTTELQNPPRTFTQQNAPSVFTSSNPFPLARTRPISPPPLSPTSNHRREESMSPSLRLGERNLGAHKRSNSDADKIVSYLQIPSEINNSRGSLAEFAVQMTCLFWFETSATLRRIEEAPASQDPVGPLARDAMPTLGFMKWVTTLLSTTQVTQNVVLLALLLVYRLKKLNPSILGKPGSEFRLTTVALMLANKFLDDNTYTNKTWAEVSGISVTEVCVMEIEFLTSMKYSLFTSAGEWKIWYKKLNRFWTYFDKASKAAHVHETSPPTPQLNSPLSMYPSGLSYNLSQGMVNEPGHLRMFTPLSQLPYVAQPSILPLSERLPDFSTQASRKRSLDEPHQEPLAKRVARSTLPPAHSTSLSNNSISVPKLPTPGLPTPLSTSTNASQHQHDSYPAHSASSYTSQLSLPQIPAMSQLYGNHGGQSRPLPQPILTQSSKSYSSITPQTCTPTSSLPPLNNPVYNRPILQPHPPSQSGRTSRTVSPTSVTFPSDTQTQNQSHTPTHHNLSPATTTHTPTSRYLTIYNHNNSPYRPIRGPNTLLVPPPPAVLHQHAPARLLSPEDMQYLPLGKPPSQSRTGVVPYMPYGYQTRGPPGIAIGNQGQGHGDQSGAGHMKKEGDAGQNSPWPYLPQPPMLNQPMVNLMHPPIAGYGPRLG